MPNRYTSAFVVCTISRFCKSRLLAAFFIAGTACSSELMAEGFRIYGHSADAQLRGEALVASASDASAIWYNPAALPGAGHTSLSINSNNMWIPSKYQDAAGREEKNQRMFFPLFGAYFSINPKKSGFAFGIGINSPFGLATEYSKNSSFRYITTGGEVVVVNLNPTVAYRFNSKFSAGVGLDYYYSTVEVRQQYPWAAVGVTNGLGPSALSLPDGEVSVKGRGDGVGYNVGFLFQPAPEHSIGLTYRSQVLVHYSGNRAEFTNIPTAFQAAMGLNQSVYATGAQSDIRYPDIFGAGYAFKPGKRTTIEIGGQITRWETVRTLDIQLDRPNAFFSNSSTKLDWKNSFVARIGAEHWFTDRFALGAGYFYDSSPTNELTYTQLIPDGDHHVLSTGFKYKINDFMVTLPIVGMIQTGTDSISKSLTTDATRTQTANGKYSSYILQVGLGLNYRFN